MPVAAQRAVACVRASVYTLEGGPEPTGPRVAGSGHKEARHPSESSGSGAGQPVTLESCSRLLASVKSQDARAAAFLKNTPTLG